MKSSPEETYPFTCVNDDILNPFTDERLAEVVRLQISTYALLVNAQRSEEMNGWRAAHLPKTGFEPLTKPMQPTGYDLESLKAS